MKYKYSYLYVMFSLLLAMLLVACGGAEESVEEPADSAAKIFTIAQVLDPSDIDPRTNYDPAGLRVISQMYEALTYFNPPGSDPEISPWLAESWESNEESTEWTFKLKEGVTFHDGSDFNAEAVQKVVEGVRDGEYVISWIFASITEIEVIDDHTIKFINEYPVPLDLIFSSGFGAWMISPDGMDQDREWFNAGHDAGTGPYQISKREVGTRIIMERSRDYWGEWNDSKFDTVVFEFVTDETVREQMIRSGDADLTVGLNPDNLESLMSTAGVEVKVMPSYENFFILFNTKKEPLNDAKVRQALALSYPYTEVLANLNSGFGTAASGMIPQTMWGADNSLIAKQDMEGAKALLAEAGYADGGFELEYWTIEGVPIFQQFAELWRPYLQDLGIELTITPIDFNAALTLAQSDPENAHDLIGLLWFPTYVSPFEPLFGAFSTGQYFNLAFYENEVFDQLVLEGNVLAGSDRESAIKLFQSANKMLVDDAVAIFIMDSPVKFVIRDDLKGFHYSPAYSPVVQVYNLER